MFIKCSFKLLAESLDVDMVQERERILMLTLKQADVRLEYKARVRFALPYSWPNINWIVA